MEFHLGRVLDHVHLRVRDLEWSRRFYQAALGALGRELRTGEGFFSADELWVTADGPPTERLHLAFQAEDEEAVRRFYAAAIAAGGKDNGAPGERAYHPGYFAAYVLDPDGNNVRPSSTGRRDGRLRPSSSRPATEASCIPPRRGVESRHDVEERRGRWPPTSA